MFACHIYVYTFFQCVCSYLIHLNGTFCGIIHVLFQGNYFEDQSALSALLKLSTIPLSSRGPEKYLPSQAAQAPFRSLRSFPRMTSDDVNTAQVNQISCVHTFMCLFIYVRVYVSIYLFLVG